MLSQSMIPRRKVCTFFLSAVHLPSKTIFRIVDNIMLVHIPGGDRCDPRSQSRTDAQVDAATTNQQYAVEPKINEGEFYISLLIRITNYFARSYSVLEFPLKSTRKSLKKIFQSSILTFTMNENSCKLNFLIGIKIFFNYVEKTLSQSR